MKTLSLKVKLYVLLLLMGLSTIIPAQPSWKSA